MRSLTSILTIICFTFMLMQPAYSQQDTDIEAMLKEGKEAYLNGEYNKAIEKLSVAVRFLRVKDDLVRLFIVAAQLDAESIVEQLVRMSAAERRVDPDKCPATLKNGQIH